MRILLTIIILFYFSFNQNLIAQQNASDFGLDEKLGNILPLDLEFYDEDGFLVRLKDVINKPTIVTFIYYRCPSVCSPLLAEVASLVNKIDFELGKDYQILSLSFDHNEKPSDAKEKRVNFISILNKPVDKKAWLFLTGDSLNIYKITQAAGFKFKIIGNEYAHPAVIIFIDKNGQITRYIYGDKYLPFDIKMGLIEAAEGRIGPTISSKFLKFCYNYDPAEKNYKLNLTRIFGFIVLILLSIFVFYLVKVKIQRNRSI